MSCYRVSIGGENLSDRNIGIKVDDMLYKQIKIKIAKEGKTLKQYILELIIADLEKSK